jgi:hypothetical protein
MFYVLYAFVTYLLTLPPITVFLRIIISEGINFIELA